MKTEDETRLSKNQLACWSWNKNPQIGLDFIKAKFNALH